jgi:hypothetical protein
MEAYLETKESASVQKEPVVVHEEVPKKWPRWKLLDH